MPNIRQQTQNINRRTILGAVAATPLVGLPLVGFTNEASAATAIPVKTDRKDACGIANLIRMGWYQPVHLKTPAARELLTALHQMYIDATTAMLTPARRVSVSGGSLISGVPGHEWKQGSGGIGSATQITTCDEFGQCGKLGP